MIKIIKATSEHAKLIDDFVKDLVEYHKITGQSILNEELLKSSIGSFSDASKYYESFLAIEYGIDTPDGDSAGVKVLGHCMYQKYFSFLSGKIIWMENLFVQNGHRGKKIGQRFVNFISD